MRGARRCGGVVRRGAAYLVPVCLHSGCVCARPAAVASSSAGRGEGVRAREMERGRLRRPTRRSSTARRRATQAQARAGAPPPDSPAPQSVAQSAGLFVLTSMHQLHTCASGIFHSCHDVNGFWLSTNCPDLLKAIASRSDCQRTTLSPPNHILHPHTSMHSFPRNDCI